MRPATLVQFSIHVRNQESAASFYRAVFGWEITRFSAPEKYGLPAHFVIENPGDPAEPLRGHIQLRPDGEPTVTGFECTVSVESLEQTATAVRANGGTIIQEVPFVAAVGGFVRFADLDGNMVQAFQFPKDVPHESTHDVEQPHAADGASRRPRG